MKNLNFLNKGQIFPPLEEAKRIGAIADYDLMFDGNTHAVEERHFRQTLDNINRLALLLGWRKTYMSVESNYFQLTSIKTADFVCGELPDILSASDDEAKKERQQNILDEIRKVTMHDKKFYDGIVDTSKYGEAYFRVYFSKQLNRNTYTLQSPAMIIPVTDEEDDYEITNYVVAWLKDNKQLCVQIHYKGYYIKRDYKVREAFPSELCTSKRFEPYEADNAKSDLYSLVLDRATDEIFRCKAYKIEEQIGSDVKVETLLDDFAIVPLSNIKNSDRTHGMSDYDRIDSHVASNQRTLTEISLIFDKYTTPTMAVPTEALREDGGENIMEIGKAVGIPEGGIIPQFLEPDLAKLEYYFRMLEYNVARIKELSEMGAALTSETTISNISTETMKTLYASAIKKSQRLTSRNTESVKKLFHLLSMSGYGEPIPEDDINVVWYDGLPDDEQKEVLVATQKITAGLSSRKRELQTRFEHTPEEAEQIVQEALEEEADFNAVRALGGFTNPFNSPTSGADGSGEQEPDETNKKGAEGQNPPDDGDGE